MMWGLHTAVSVGWQLYLVVLLGLVVLLVIPVATTMMVTALGPKMYGSAMGLQALVMQAALMMAGPLAAASWSWLHANAMPPSIAYLAAAAECILSVGIF